MKQSGHLNSSEETGTGFHVKHGCLGGQSPTCVGVQVIHGTQVVNWTACKIKLNLTMHQNTLFPMPVTSKYGRTPPNKHGGVGRQQQHCRVNESGRGVFGKFCPVGFLVVCKCSSVLL